MSSSRKKKRTILVSFNETQRSFSGSASALLAPPPAFGSTHNSWRINVAAYRDPNKSYALPSVTPLETLLKNLKIDPIEKAEQDAGITVQIKNKRYRNSVSSFNSSMFPCDHESCINRTHLSLLGSCSQESHIWTSTYNMKAVVGFGYLETIDARIVIQLWATGFAVLVAMVGILIARIAYSPHMHSSRYISLRWVNYLF